MTKSFDACAEWLRDHPWTLAYIAFVVTASLILQIVEAL
jgi:hypothetical protein